jgi:hypothetical protein
MYRNIAASSVSGENISEGLPGDVLVAFSAVTGLSVCGVQRVGGVDGSGSTDRKQSHE